MYPTLETISAVRKTAAEFLFDLASFSTGLGYPRELKDTLGHAADHWYRWLKEREEVFSKRGPFEPVDPEKVDALRKREQEDSERADVRRDERRG